MITAVSPDGDRFGGLSPPYKRNYHPLPEGFTFPHPGRPTPPNDNAIGTPAIRASVSTDRKKTNAQIVYTRITPLDSHLVAGKAEGCVFVSRSQMLHTNTGPEKRSLMAGLEAVNLRLDAHVPESQLAVAYNPLDEWRRLPQLREWPLDGVLLGLDNEVNASQTLNVCVAGPCPVRNVFNEDVVMPLDYCYLMLVAELRHKDTPTEHWHFKYVPCTSRTLAEPKERGKRMLTRVPALSEEQRWHAVGGWRLGRVMDGKAVDKIDQKTMTVDVRIEWVGWRALRLEYPESQIGGVLRKHGLLKRRGAPLQVNTCLTFHWPTAMPDKRDAPIEAPSKPSMNAWELGRHGGMTKNTHAIADEARRGRFTSKRSALGNWLNGMKPPGRSTYKPSLGSIEEADAEGDGDGDAEANDKPAPLPLPPLKPQPRYKRPLRPLRPMQKMRPIPEVDEATFNDAVLPTIEEPLQHVVCMLALWFELKKERGDKPFGVPESPPNVGLYFAKRMRTNDLAEAGGDINVADPSSPWSVEIICTAATATAMRFLERLADMNVYDDVCAWLQDDDSAKAGVPEPWWLFVVGRDLDAFYAAYPSLLRRMVRNALLEKCELDCGEDFQEALEQSSDDEYTDAPELEPEPEPALPPMPAPPKKKQRVAADEPLLFAPGSPASSVEEDAEEAVESEAKTILEDLKVNKEQQSAALDKPSPVAADVKDWMRPLLRRSSAWMFAHSSILDVLQRMQTAKTNTQALLELRERLVEFLGRTEGEDGALFL